MALKTLCTVALGCLVATAATAFGQVPMLVNGNLETPDPDPIYSAFAGQGWRTYNYSRWRYPGDGQGAPTTIVARSGTHSAMLPGGQGRPNGEFEAIHAEEQLDRNDLESPRNWPQFTFDPPNGAPLNFEFWFNIPADDAMVVSRFGLKVCILRNAPGDFSCFQTWEFFDIDPDNPMPYPGTVLTNRTGPFGPAGETITLPAVHTNGRWVRHSKTILQSEFCTDFGGTCPMPPTNPAHLSLMSFRFDFPANPPCGGEGQPTCIRNRSYGTIWVDDFVFKQGMICHADFNGNGPVTVQDLFDFLAAWFATSTLADFTGNGSVTVGDLFAYLAAWFAKCP